MCTTMEDEQGFEDVLSGIGGGTKAKTLAAQLIPKALTAYAINLCACIRVLCIRVHAAAS